MAKAIEDAIAGLVEKPADYTAVNAAKAKAEKLDSSLYTTDSYKAVTDAVKAVVTGKTISQQAEVDAMAKAIEDAIAGLVEKPADYSKVEAAAAKANKLNKSLYTEESFAAVTKAVSAVKKGLTISEQDKVDQMAKAIEDAIAGLKEKPAVPQFKDVTDPDNEWFYDYVYEIAATSNSKGTPLMSGYKNDKGEFTGYFGPADPLMRQDFAVMLYRLANEPDVTVTKTPAFPDADTGAYYYKAIVWAQQEGVITGYNDGRFGVGHNITREQVATILYRYAKSAGLDTSAKGDLSKFSDVGLVSDFAKDALVWANGVGIVTGKADGRIDPQGNATRAEIAKMVTVFLSVK